MILYCKYINILHGISALSINSLFTIQDVTPFFHACGELFLFLYRTIVESGSSPRMWGTLLLAPETMVATRFIPTHVGNSIDTLPSCDRSPVHPHACGELAITVSFLALSYGSSPRMWGTPTQLQFEFLPMRFIPTHVGNSQGGGVPVV